MTFISRELSATFPLHLKLVVHFSVAPATEARDAVG